MNFAEAWALLLLGHGIRRKSWDKGFYWYRHGCECWQFNPEEPMHPNYEMSLLGDVGIDEATATDWEEV
jgi:hypothetical protein